MYFVRMNWLEGIICQYWIYSSETLVNLSRFEETLNPIQTNTSSTVDPEVFEI
jgi:hypothetical protein